MSLRRATTADLHALRGLLVAEGLPSEGLEAPGGSYFVWEKGDALVAMGGHKRSGASPRGLLRSFVVAPEHRGKGIAQRIYEATLEDCRSAGVTALYLLTTTAPGYFEARGFSRIAREEAPEEIRRTEQFSTLCPDSAQLMRLLVEDSEQSAGSAPEAC